MNGAHLVQVECGPLLGHGFMTALFTDAAEAERVAGEVRGRRGCLCTDWPFGPIADVRVIPLSAAEAEKYRQGETGK
jgi:hypothetical protein